MAKRRASHLPNGKNQLNILKKHIYLWIAVTKILLPVHLLLSTHTDYLDEQTLDTYFARFCTYFLGYALFLKLMLTSV